MKIEIDTNKTVPAIARLKADKLQLLSDRMNDEVLSLFAGIAQKAKTQEEIEAFNKKVLSKKILIQTAFL